MKGIPYTILLLITSSALAQQKETFDLATFTAPAGWQKSNTNDVVSYSIVDNQRGTYCQIGIYKSTISKGSLQTDFKSEWQDLVVKTYKPNAAPEVVPSAAENGWDAQGGAAPFEFSGAQSVVMLVTMSGYGRSMSIVIVTNTEDYQPEIEKFLEMVTPLKPETALPANNSSTTVIALPVTSENAPIIGTWGRGNSVTKPGGSFGRWSYTKQQYTFSANGTYRYVRKNYVEDDKETYLTLETGSYAISGDNVTLSPKSNVIEAWSKTNGGDNYKNIITSQHQPLEKVTYGFTIHYFQELKESGLVLIYGNQTVRDGDYNAGDSFPNGWRFSPAPNYTPIKLPGE